MRCHVPLLALFALGSCSQAIQPAAPEAQFSIQDQVELLLGKELVLLRHLDEGASAIPIPQAVTLHDEKTLWQGRYRLESHDRKVNWKVQSWGYGCDQTEAGADCDLILGFSSGCGNCGGYSVKLHYTDTGWSGRATHWCTTEGEVDTGVMVRLLPQGEAQRD